MADPRFFEVEGPFNLEQLAQISGSKIGGNEKKDVQFLDIVPLISATNNDVSFIDNSRYIGDYLKKSGFETSYASDYLLERNWLQICTMGEVDLDEISNVIDILYSIYAQTKTLIG